MEFSKRSRNSECVRQWCTWSSNRIRTFQDGHVCVHATLFRIAEEWIRYGNTLRAGFIESLDASPTKQPCSTRTFARADRCAFVNNLNVKRLMQRKYPSSETLSRFLAADNYFPRRFPGDKVRIIGFKRF